MQLDFNDRHVVVTGATGELGEAVARLLVECGATVHVPARSVEKAGGLYARSESRVRIASVPDLADEDAVSDFYAALPPLWASVHCAGGFAWGRLDDITLADFRKMTDMNAVASFLCTREAVKNLRGRGGGIGNRSAPAGTGPRRAAG